MIPLSKAREAYDRDTTYRSAVDMMRSIIQKLEMTPSELREAAMLACIIEAERSPTPFAIRAGYERRGLDEARSVLFAAADFEKWATR